MARRKKGAEAPVKEAPEEGATESAQAAPERTVISDEEMFQAGRAWYVVHTYSGYEDKARTNLEQRIKSMDAEDIIFYAVVASVAEIEIREGLRRPGRWTTCRWRGGNPGCEEDPVRHQAPAGSGQGDAGAPRRPCPGPARRQ